MQRQIRIFFPILLLIGISGCQRKPDPAPPAPAPPPVVEPDPIPSPTVSLSLSPNTIEAGQHSTLSWSSENGTTLEINNGIGATQLSGEIVLSPSESTTYIAIVKGAGGEARASSRLTVVEPQPEPIVRSDAEILSELISQGKINPVYFAYDKAQLSGEAKSTLSQNASYFNRYSNTNLVIEGHCDERGSDEYNLALGDRRANAVLSYLTQLGVASGRLQSVSFGEERPAKKASSEAAYALNRRAEFKIR